MQDAPDGIGPKYGDKMKIPRATVDDGSATSPQVTFTRVPVMPPVVGFVPADEPLVSARVTPKPCPTMIRAAARVVMSSWSSRA